MAERRPERIGAGRAGEICGYTPKTMRKLARQGKIPGAALATHRSKTRVSSTGG
jgi:hypothetical protein